MKLLQAYRAHFLGAEFVLAVLLWGAFLFWAHRLSGYQDIDALLQGNRGAIYGALVSLFGTLLGFSIATVSIILGLVDSKRLNVLRESTHYPTLWRVFNSSNRALGIATVASLVGLVMDKDGAPCHLILDLVVFLMLLSGFRVARCVWILENVIHLITLPTKARDGAEATTEDDDAAD